jgi:hypothetical protein
LEQFCAQEILNHLKWHYQERNINNLAKIKELDQAQLMEEETMVKDLSQQEIIFLSQL